MKILAAGHPRDPALNVWIEAGAIILPSVSIHEHAVVHAGSVVACDVLMRANGLDGQETRVTVHMTGKFRPMSGKRIVAGTVIQPEGRYGGHRLDGPAGSPCRNAPRDIATTIG